MHAEFNQLIKNGYITEDKQDYAASILFNQGKIKLNEHEFK